MPVLQTRGVRRLGRYELHELLGAGGMSEVYAGVHLGLQKRVAIKLLTPALREDADSVARFLREGECAARVRHPNVVDVHDVGLEQGVPYLAMELLHGETLEARLLRAGPYTLAAALDVLLPLVDAVACIHAAGVIHRDIKPGNVVLSWSADGSQCPKLVDFGVATVSERRAITGRLGPIGTPQYMSPEQALGSRRLGCASDQYSLASMLFEMLTGSVPFGGGRVESVLQAVSRGVFPQLGAHVAKLPPGFEAVMERATLREPAARYASVRELGRALLPFANAQARAELGARFEPRSAGNELPTRPPVRAAGERTAGGATTRRAPRVGPRQLATLSVGVIAMSLGLAVGVAQTSSAAPPSERAPALGPGTAVSVHALAPPPKLRVLPAHASVELDGTLLGVGSLPSPRSADRGLHALRISAPGYVTRVVLFRGAPEVGEISLARRAEMR